MAVEGALDLAVVCEVEETLVSFKKLSELWIEGIHVAEGFLISEEPAGESGMVVCCCCCCCCCGGCKWA